MNAVEVLELDGLLDDRIESNDLLKFQATKTHELYYIVSLNPDLHILIKDREVTCSQLLCDPLDHAAHRSYDDLCSLKLFLSLFNSSPSLHDAHVKCLDKVQVSVALFLYLMQVLNARAFDRGLKDELASSSRGIKGLSGDCHAGLGIIDAIGFMSELRLVDDSLALQLVQLSFELSQFLLLHMPLLFNFLNVNLAILSL